MDVTADVVEQRRERLHALLWPPGEKPLSVWAVLDGARDPAIYAALLESRLEFRCLYSGRIPRELERVAPQLVELMPGHRLTQRLLGSAWGCNWGVLLTTEEPEALRPHLRRWLKVQTEDGRRLLFRFYDPRVLRAWLPSCLPDELDRFFGPIERFICEGGGGRSTFEFGRAGGKLASRQLALPAPAPPTAG